MLQTMQDEALYLAAKALDVFDITDSTQIARFIKQEFDRLHGLGWQCIVGIGFGSFLIHVCGCFIHFCIGSLAILLFKCATGPEAEKELFTALEPVKE
ncbi:dynein light chain 1, cytoplasmic-like [Telopea speciosissima]|uniref:dynein light chain 1, cytoplasmic-like n=1 Tax=Telopea speciosissima TaxID=54955 RepID=UPI001CC515E9|nr:dynein light chain 1, cytoplasmic-like [Telopea speciosissima]